MNTIRSIATVLLLLTTPTVAQKSVYPSDADLAEKAREGAESLRRCLGDEWTITVEGPRLKVESKFDVYHVFMISRSLGPPPFSDDDITEAFKKEAIPISYIIELTYKLPISREEFTKSREQRQKHADVLNFGAASKSEWGAAAKKYLEIKLPRYRHGFYDIYRQLPDTPGKMFYPPRAVRAIGSAKEIIDTLFGRTISGID